MNKLRTVMKNYEKKEVDKVLILDVHNVLFRTLHYAFKSEPKDIENFSF